METRLFTTPFGRDIEFTRLGLGCATIANYMGVVSDADAEATLQAAWAGGIRYFDTAPFYGFGLSEQRLGRFLSGLPRDEFVVSTKVGRLLQPGGRGLVDRHVFRQVPDMKVAFDYSYDGVMRSWEASRKRLGLDRIDILYVHDVDVFTHGTREAADARVDELMAGGYRALVELRAGGAIKAFGAGLNEWQYCEKLLKRGEFDLFLLAGRYTLLEQESLDSFLPLCERRGVGIVIGGPFNSGILAVGPSEGALYNYEPAPAPVLDKARAIAALCARRSVPLAQAALQFAAAHPAVVSVIPGGRSPDEVERNIEFIDAFTPQQLWSEIKDAGLIRREAPVPGW